MTILLAFLLAAQGSIAPDALNTARTDLFAKAIPSSEPTMSDMWKIASPFTGKALLGSPFGLQEATVTPDGAAVAALGSDRIWLKFYLPSGNGVSPIFSMADRTASDPRYLVAKHLVKRGGLEWIQKSYVSQDVPGQNRLIIELGARNTTNEHVVLSPELAYSWLAGIGADSVAMPEARNTEPTITYLGARLAVTRYIVTIPRPQGVKRGGMDKPWKSFRLELGKQTVAPGDSTVWMVTFALWEEKNLMATLEPNQVWNKTSSLWRQALKKTAEYSVPEPGWNAARFQLLAQLLTMADSDRLRYSSYPNILADVTRGVEEGSALEALAMWGLAEEAKTLTEGTLLSSDMLLQEGALHQFRMGTAASTAWSIYLLTGDKVWLDTALISLRPPLEALRESAKTTGILPAGPASPDVDQLVNGLAANAVTWRGIRDMAFALSACGYPSEGAPFTKAAGTLRSEIGQRFVPTGQFMPLFIGDKASAVTLPAEYSRLSAFVLGSGVFGPGAPQAEALVGYLTETGRIQAGLPMRNGMLDAAHALGFQEYRLAKLDGPAFRLALWALVAYALDPVWGTCAELAPALLTSKMAKTEAEEQDEYFTKNTDPNSATAAAVLQCMRRMLVEEERGQDGAVGNSLLLFSTAPDRWFSGSQPFYVKNLPTAFGTVGVTVTRSTKAATCVFTWAGNGPLRLATVKMRKPAWAKRVSAVGATVQEGNGWVAFPPAAKVTVTFSR